MSLRTPLPEPIARWFEGVIEEGMLWLDQLRSHTRDFRSETFTFNPASLAASTTREESMTVTGVKVGDIILAVSKPTHTANYIVGGSAYVSAVDTVKVSVSNPHPSSSADPGSETWRITYIKNTK